MQIEVLRLGHRLPRDERISTHVALVARAFGAESVVYSGQHDQGLEESVRRICQSWGGNVHGSFFQISYEKNFLRHLKFRKSEGYTVIHLTMYGLPLEKCIPEAKKGRKLLIVVGSEQVPGSVFSLSDYNLSVTNQPHSEVAALAITLDRIMDGRELEKDDFKGKIRIVPSANGKNVQSNE